MNNAGVVRFVVFFCAGLLLFTACKSSEDSETVYYTVTFDAAGGSPETETRTVQSGDTVGSNMPSNPARHGDTFVGWYTQQNGSGSRFTGSSPVYGHITVYALWTETEYTVTFDAGQGRPSTQSRTVPNGSSLTVSNMPSTPSNGAYIFNGWYTEHEGGGSEFTGTTSVTGDITVYAWWTLEPSPIQYTVTFEVTGGSPEPEPQTVLEGALIGSSHMPLAPTQRGYVFDGWYTAATSGGAEFTAATPVTGDITVYARWRPFDSLSLDEALTWINTNAAPEAAYTITLNNDETIAPKSLNCSEKTVNITLTGGTTERTISLRSTGSLFTVENGVTLTLGENITLQGRNNNTASLIRVKNGGILVMETGSKIRENTSNYSYQGVSSIAGGVHVDNQGTFTMSGGTISGNTALPYSAGHSYGGGVYVDSQGTFTMHDGTITGNTALLTSQTTGSSCSGGGVYVANSGTFTMSGGTISGNTATAPADAQGYSEAYGGGVYVASAGIFTMNDGTISGNTASTPASLSLPALSTSYGGGVYVATAGTFTKAGGVIYGSDAEAGLKNTATSGDLSDGQAVYVQYSKDLVRIRNTTANTNTSLNSGSTAGWE